MVKNQNYHNVRLYKEIEKDKKVCISYDRN